MSKNVECTTQEELAKCCKDGNIAIVHTGIFRAYDSSQVTACDSSQVTACGSSQVRACGYVAITQQSNNAKIRKTKTCKLIKPPPISDIDDYLQCYPIEKSGKSIILYKAVSPELKSLCSDKPLQYPEKGIVKNDKIDPPEKGSCANGLHFAHFDWAVRFGCNYTKFVILKARIAKDSIVVSPDCDGKIRTNKAETLEVITDWQKYKPFPQVK